jgi:hypothetical protein
MLFFRSEVDLDAWLQAKNASRGATLTMPQLWQLSQHWYQDRMHTEYRGRTLEQVHRIFRDVGLVSKFWQ